MDISRRVGCDDARFVQASAIVARLMVIPREARAWPFGWWYRYRANEYAYGREPNDFLRAEAARIPRGRILCLAEGEGRNAVFLAGRGHDVTAVDFSAEGLRKTERLAREHAVKVTTVCAERPTRIWPVTPFARATLGVAGESPRTCSQ